MKEFKRDEGYVNNLRYIINQLADLHKHLINKDCPSKNAENKDKRKIEISNAVMRDLLTHEFAELGKNKINMLEIGKTKPDIINLQMDRMEQFIL